MNIGLYNYYKIHNQRMLTDPFAVGGAGDTNYPIVLLARLLKEKNHNVEIICEKNLGKLEKAIFFEFPEIRRTGRPNKLLTKLVKINRCENFMVCFEPETIKPNNWVSDNHKYFKKIFTWHDELIDNKKYFRSFSTSHKQTEKVDFDISKKTGFCALIARNKYSLSGNELYSKRKEIINWFEVNAPKDFDLYGYGWDKYKEGGFCRIFNLIDSVLDKTILKYLKKTSGTSNLFHFLLNLHPYRRLSYKGEIDSTRETLKKYKFSICFENTILPGWITERIFDSFLAGCVPVYLGDPNITQKIPAPTFIDMRNFAGFKELFSYLKNMEESDYLNYIKEIKTFINTDKSYQFSSEYFAQTLMKEII